MEYLRHAPDKPWLLTVSFTNPHPPYKVPKKYWEMYKDADIPLPDYPADMTRDIPTTIMPSVAGMVCMFGATKSATLRT